MAKTWSTTVRPSRYLRVRSVVTLVQLGPNVELVWPDCVTDAMYLVEYMLTVMLVSVYVAHNMIPYGVVFLTCR